MRSPFTPGTERPCHYRELFVASNGDVYPCCLTWNKPALRIGHITDPDLEERLLSFDGSCRCSSFTLRKGKPSDKREYKLNVETGLACNGRCAMCCVDAPSSHSPYLYYGELDRLIETLPAINHLVVQGGEVLIQKKTMDWLRALSLRRPEIPLALITNGNVEADTVPFVESLFFNVLVSVYGFQDETYRRITRMELEKTLRFAGDLVKRKRTTVHLKYLVTPLNLHELPLFLRARPRNDLGDRLEHRSLHQPGHTRPLLGPRHRAHGRGSAQRARRRHAAGSGHRRARRRALTRDVRHR